MFTGIIEEVGLIKSVDTEGTNTVFWIESKISSQLSPDQSVCHNGVCLTVEEVTGHMHRVTAIKETLAKTNLGMLKTGDLINLERSMVLNDRIDGHIVQGHVDSTVECIKVSENEGSTGFTFAFDEKFAQLIVEKGSVCLDGVSLTVFNVTRENFTVAIIPFTMQYTNFRMIEKGSIVNVEFDILGKYVQRMIQLKP